MGSYFTGICSRNRPYLRDLEVDRLSIKSLEVSPSSPPSPHPPKFLHASDWLMSVHALANQNAGASRRHAGKTNNWHHQLLQLKFSKCFHPSPPHPRATREARSFDEHLRKEMSPRSELSFASHSSPDLEDDVAFAAQMCKVKDVVRKARPAPPRRRAERPLPAVKASADSVVSLPLYVAEEDRRRFLQQARKAAEKYGVKLVRPHAGNLVAPFLVQGQREAARAFIQHTEDCVRGRSDETASPDIAPEHYGKAIGKGGARLKYITEKYGVRVSVPKDRESPIAVSGQSESVRGAVREMEELVRQDLLKRRVALPVKVLPEDIGVVIGKGGCHAAQIQEEFGVRLRTQSHEHPQSPLVVEGPLDAAERAVASIQLRVAERRRLNEAYAEERRRREELRGTIPVRVEPGRVGMAIGKGAFRVRHVAQRHRVRIQLPERNKPDGQILVTGLKDDARAAVAELELMAKLKLRPEHVLVPLRVKSEEHILVLGPEGCRAAWLGREFGVRVVRPSADGPLMLEGGVEAVARAEAHVEGVIAQRRLATRPSPLPLPTLPVSLATGGRASLPVVQYWWLYALANPRAASCVPNPAILT
ncbi:Vigilin [Penaeus vannamei]|uniref:Vigilin n=1 Tax=Penaeus vannamei TaxID=6689 RepID=A0A423T090_PENVA|nr:Vigilin [Penaeus vannamei]